MKPLLDCIGFKSKLLKTYFIFYRHFFHLPKLFPRSVKTKYMTKIKNLEGKFQEVAVQFKNKADKKIIEYITEYINVPL